MFITVRVTRDLGVCHAIYCSLYLFLTSLSYRQTTSQLIVWSKLWQNLDTIRILLTTKGLWRPNYLKPTTGILVRLSSAYSVCTSMHKKEAWLQFFNRWQRHWYWFSRCWDLVYKPVKYSRQSVSRSFNDIMIVRIWLSQKECTLSWSGSAR